MKIRLINPNVGRNNQAFYIFKSWKKLFNEVEIEFTDQSYGKFDYVFIGIDDFVDRKLSLDDSINKGIEFVNKFKYDRVFLFDCSDSTSLLGSYEVLNGTNAAFLFKNQILDFDEYNKPSPFNKWFWDGDEFNISYNIPIKNRQRIRLSGWNLGHTHPEYHIFDYTDVSRDIDVCAVYQHTHDENYDFGHRNDIHYTNHRSKPFELLDNIKEKTPNFNFITGKLEQKIYFDTLKKSKVALSPYGMGEMCYRDFELMIFNVPMIKPDMSKIITEPNIYIPWETYIPVKHDWSDLEAVLDKFLGNYNEYKNISDNFRSKFRVNYLISDIIQKWLKILK